MAALNQSQQNFSFLLLIPKNFCTKFEQNQTSTKEVAKYDIISGKRSINFCVLVVFSHIYYIVPNFNLIGGKIKELQSRKFHFIYTLKQKANND